MSELNRRDALKVLAAAGVAAAGCTRSTVDDKEAKSMEATSPREPARQPILAMQPLVGFPWPTLDPFLFCVHHDDRYPKANEHFGPAASLEGRNLGQDFEGKDGWRMYHGTQVPGFPAHPHRGFETVTIVREGLIDHSDSLGAAARYGGGDVQWLTAGRGIQHAEMFPLLDREGTNRTELFQIWLNLPRANKFVDPYFSMFWADRIPRITHRDDQGRVTSVTVVAGALAGATPLPPPPHSRAAQPDADLAIWTIKMAPGARWTLPAASTDAHRVLYFFQGSGLSVAGVPVASAQLVQLRPELAVELQAGSDEVELLLLQGRPLGEPVVQYGPFVMSSREEIHQAFADYQRTRFGGWPWDAEDPVHGREQRFARRPDGTIERPG